MKEILEIENIGKKYQHKNGETLAIKNINLKVKEGEFISIIGPSRMWKIYIAFYNFRIRRKIGRKDFFRR